MESTFTESRSGLSKRKKRVFALVLLAGGLLAGLIAAETVLRIAGYSSPEFYTAHETRELLARSCENPARQRTI